MGAGNSFVLRIVESHEVSPEPGLPPQQAPTASRDLTPYEVLDVLGATNGAASVIEQIPAIEGPDLWGQVASFSVCGTSGTAEGGVFLWDCDHVGDIGSMQQNLANCYALFSAHEFAHVGSPGTLTGRACCFFTAPDGGNYVFHVQLASFLDQDSPSRVECFIDQQSFGEIQVPGFVNVSLVAKLVVGRHQFQIRQVSGSFFFQKLRVWFVPSDPIP